MVQTRLQRRNRISAVRARLSNIYNRAARYRGVNPLISSSNTSRRVGYILNAAQRIGQAYQAYRRRRTRIAGRMAMNRRLPTEMSRLIGTYL